MSTGEFIDTWPFSYSWLVVNCCQHVEDLKAIGNSQYQNNSLSLKIESL